jgi:hypothetical protein
MEAGQGPNWSCNAEEKKQRLYKLMLIMICFDPYCVIIRCISVYLDAEFLFNIDPYFSFIFDHIIMSLLFSSEPLICLLFGFKPYWYNNNKKLRGLSPQARTIPTERPPLVNEVSANFSGQRVSHGQDNKSPTAVNFGFLDRNRYFLEIAPQLSSRG